MSSAQDLLSSRTVDRIPVEIARYIVRLATNVPVAFDTSRNTVVDEDPIATRRLILESLRTKCALSLTSKKFHVLVQEYMYDIVLIRRHPVEEVVQNLLELLWTSAPGDSRPRGHRVRRLELHFHLAYDGNQWCDPVGLDTLWGFPAACPNLEALFLKPQTGLDTFDQFPQSHFHHVDCVRSSDWLFLTGREELGLTIAGSCGRRLRRLDIAGGIMLKEDTLQCMIASMPVLEAVYVCGPLHGHGGPPSHEKWSPHLLPLEEQTERLHTLIVQKGVSLMLWENLPLKRLQHVCVLGWDAPVQDQILTFLRAHASTIISLHYHRRQQEDRFLRKILDVTRSLEHLRIQGCPGASWDKLLPTKPLKYLRNISLIDQASRGGSMLDPLASINALVVQLDKGRIPALKKIYLGGYRPNIHPPSPRLGAKLKGMGISWHYRPELPAWIHSFLRGMSDVSQITRLPDTSAPRLR